MRAGRGAGRAIIDARTEPDPDPNPLQQFYNSTPFKARLPWALAGLALALLVVLVLPSAQIRVGAATLQGLVGTYTAPGGWQAVACNADGSTPVANAMLDNEGMLLMGGTENTAVHINYPDALKALARTDGSYQEAFFPYDDTVSPFNGATVPAWSEPGLGIGLFSSSAEARAGNFCAHGGTYSDGSGSHTITGGVTTHVSGHLHAYYKWAWTGAGAPPTDPPDHIDLLVHTSLWAGASAGYGASGKTSGLTATASATDARFGDTVSADASGTPSASSDRKHLARLDTSGTGPASFDLDGSTDQSVDDTLPYGEFGPYPGYPGTSGYFRTTNGQTRATSNAFIKAASRIANLTLGAHSTRDTDGWDAQHPRFFSGTNCSASGSVGIDKALISQAKLLINGTVVKLYPDPSNPSQGPNLSVTFDSTQFGDGAQIEIKYQVLGRDDSSPVEIPVTANAYNKGYLLSNVTLANGGTAITDVGARLGGMNHSPTPSTADKDNIIGALPASTVFYAYTHSLIDNGSTAFGDGSAQGSGDTQYRIAHYVFSFEVLSQANTKTVNQPPYNFAFADGCQSAVQSDLAYAFLYGNSGEGQGAADRAYFGWNVDVLDNPHNVNWTNRMWQNLQNGETLSNAIRDAGQNQDAPVGVGEDGIPVYLSDDQHTIFGDGGMKLHGVWGGTGANQLSR